MNEQFRKVSDYMPYQLNTDLAQNVDYFNKVLNVDENFDVLTRNFKTGGKQATIYAIDGFVKDEVVQKMLVTLEAIKEDAFPKTPQEFVENHIDYIETELVNASDDILKNLLSGVAIIFIDTYDQAFAIDARQYPARSVDEPEKDKVLRGSRDGFVETIVFNTALIRRRIRSPQLTNKMLSVGETSKTDVVVSYMADRCDPKLLNLVLDKLSNVKIDSLALNQESLSECISKRNWWNPFPRFKFTERPDTAAACLLEGSILVLVDTAPSAMVIPTSIFDVAEEANEYYFPPITGTYLKFSRFLVNLVSLILTPLFVLLMDNPEYIPKGLEFIKVHDTMNIPLIWQFLILEFTIDGLKLASISTPNMLSTPLSIVAGLVIGDFAVSSGWFNAESMLYMAFVIIANYSQINFELGYALKFMRILILITTSIFGLWGFIGGIILAILLMVCSSTLSGHSYIYPLIPFNGKKLLHRLFRVNIKDSKDQRVR